MMRIPLFVYFLAIAAGVNAQNVIEWSPNSHLTLADFKSPGTDTTSADGASFQSGVQLEFGYMMSNAEFMMTKNWNSKVRATFTKSVSFIIAPDATYAQHMVDFCQVDFDLAELYARKLRKELYENKKAFSSMDFFRPFYDQMQQEYGERRAAISRETNIGIKSDILQQRRAEILEQLNMMTDFCKECKPVKKKK